VSQTIEVRVPDLGNFAEVSVIDVLVKPGDSVAVDTPLITLETEKATMDVPSSAAGKVVAVHVQKGGKVSEGALVVTLEVADAASAAVPAAPAASTAPVPAAAPAVATAAAQPISIDVTVPGGELVANREPDEHHGYTDVYVAIRDAFDAICRQLEDYAQRQSREVKTHEVPPHGRVVELHPDEDYGRIETPDGRLIYFHRNSVIDADFDRLQPGTEVRFSEETGEQGDDLAGLAEVRQSDDQGVGFLGRHGVLETCGGQSIQVGAVSPSKGPAASSTIAAALVTVRGRGVRAGHKNGRLEWGVWGKMPGDPRTGHKRRAARARGGGD
jgi:cold shock CspA family protein